MIEQLRALFPGPRQAAPASEDSDTEADFLDWMQPPPEQESDTPPDMMALFMQPFGLPAPPLPVKIAAAALVGIEDLPQPALPQPAAAEGDLLAALPTLSPLRMAVPIATPPPQLLAAPQEAAVTPSAPAMPVPQDAPILPVLNQQISLSPTLLDSTTPLTMPPQPLAAPQDAPILPVLNQQISPSPTLLDSTAPLTMPLQPLAEPLMRSIAAPTGLPADPTIGQVPVPQQPAAEIAEPEALPRGIPPSAVAVAVSQPDRAASLVTSEMPAQISVTEFAVTPPKPRRDHTAKDAATRDFKDVEPAPATPDSEPAQVQFTQTLVTTEQPDAQQSDAQPLDVQAAPAQMRTADQPRVSLAAPANLTGQLLHHAATAIERQVDVVLTPEELGRVKFQIRHNGDSVSILLTAERVDTMEMLKRHGEELMREFRQAGFAGATLDFGRWGQQSQSQQQAPASFAMAEDFALTPTPLRPVPSASHAGDASDASGLNIRL